MLQKKGSRSIHSIHARSKSKYSKNNMRFNFHEALASDRARIEKLKLAGWRQRLNSLKVYPWKFFIVFMAGWSYLGLYVVPYLKEENQKKVGDLR